MKINLNVTNHILFWLKHYQEIVPEKTFIFSIDQNINVSYKAAFQTCCRIGNFLKVRKIKANDRIALLSNNSIEHLLTYFGVMSYGATICTINVEMNQNNLNYILNRIAPKLVLYDNITLLPDSLSEYDSLPLGSWTNSISGSFFEKLDFPAAICAPRVRACSSIDAAAGVDGPLFFHAFWINTGYLRCRFGSHWGR